MRKRRPSFVPGNSGWMAIQMMTMICICRCSDVGDSMILNIRALPPSPNVVRRKYKNPHDYKRLREEWERMLAYAVGSAQERDRWRRTANGGAQVRLDARLYHKKLYDPDNLIGSLKLVIDALRNIGYIHNDDAAHFELGTVEQIVSDEITTVLHLSVVEHKPEAA